MCKQALWLLLVIIIAIIIRSSNHSWTFPILYLFCSLLHASPQPFFMAPMHFVPAAFTDVKQSLPIRLAQLLLLRYAQSNSSFIDWYLCETLPLCTLCCSSSCFHLPQRRRKHFKYFLSTLGTLWVADISSYRRVQPTPYINWKKFCVWLHTSWAQRWFCSSQCFLLIPHILQETWRTSSLIKAVFSYSIILSEDPVTYVHVSLLFHSSGISK